MNEMRKHQREMGEIADRIIAGAFPSNDVTLDCTPGGGKTGAATLFANKLLDAGLIDRVLWVVPRLSLAEQVVDAFSRGLGARASRQLQVADLQDQLFAPTLPNTPNVVGCVATYHAVATKKNWARFADALAAGRGLVIFDEVQFLNDESESGWFPKVNRVKLAAAYSLVMSGTLWRTDKGRIPFVSYKRNGDGLSYPLCDVSYSLRDAVAEKAVLPTEWRNRGGLVEYSAEGQVHICDLKDDGDEEESRKLRTFLSSERAVGQVLDDAVEHWREWCREAYQSRMIVMADDTAQARRWRDYLASRHGIPCVLATSKEVAGGRKLRYFREKKEGQCLVTVAMAYVGFDCPDLTHLAYLSTTRAPSWLLQSFARVSRYHHGPIPYERQHAFVFAPDDARMRAFMSWLRDQQAMGVADRREGRGPKADGCEPLLAQADDFEPIEATAGDVAVESLSSRIEPARLSQLAAFVARCPEANGVAMSKLDAILSRAGVELTREVTGVIGR